MIIEKRSGGVCVCARTTLFPPSFDTHFTKRTWRMSYHCRDNPSAPKLQSDLMCFRFTPRNNYKLIWRTSKTVYVIYAVYNRLLSTSSSFIEVQYFSNIFLFTALQNWETRALHNELLRKEPKLRKTWEKASLRTVSDSNLPNESLGVKNGWHYRFQQW